MADEREREETAEALLRRISEVEAQIETERAKGRAARARVHSLEATVSPTKGDAVGEGGGRDDHRGRQHGGHSKHHRHHRSRSRGHGRRSHRSRPATVATSVYTGISRASSASLPMTPAPDVTNPKYRQQARPGTDMGPLPDVNLSETTKYRAERIAGKAVKNLLFDPSVKAVNVFETTAGVSNTYNPKSARLAIGVDWDLRRGRSQTELTRYVDVVLRQNMKPFQSTAMKP